MKFYAYLAAAFIFSAPVLGAEKIKVKLTPNEATALWFGLNALDGYDEIVHDARGEQTVAHLHYDLGDVKIALAFDKVVAVHIHEDFQSARKGLSDDEATKLADVPQEVELLQINVNELNLQSNKKMPPGALAQLKPICKGCTAD